MNTRYRLDPASLSQFRSMSFPLGVFSYAMALEEGEAEYLHYGLFQDAETSLQEAQAHSTNLLLQCLPTAPCRILEVGIGLGTTFGKLSAMGHQVTGISPDVAQIERAQERLGEDADLRCATLEELEPDDEGYDLLLFQESAQYIHSLALIEAALKQLKPGGQLLIIDEFALKRGGPGAESLHLLSHFRAQMERFGFDLQKERDLSDMAAPTLDYLIRVLARHRETLMRDMALSSEELDGLDRSNAAYRDKYRSGRFGYALLDYRAPDNPAWLPRFQAQGSPSLRVHDQEGLLVECETTPLTLYSADHSSNILQLGIEETEAATLASATLSPATEAAVTSLLESTTGPGRASEYALTCTDTRTAGKLGAAGLFLPVETILKVTWNCRPSHPRLLSRLEVLPIQRLEEQRKTLETLWQSMRDDPGLPYNIDRSPAAFLARVQARNPERIIALLVRHRFKNRPLAMMLLQAEEHGSAEMLEVLGAPVHLPLLLLQARRFLGVGQHCRLQARLSSSLYSALDPLHQAESSTEVAVLMGSCWTGEPINPRPLFLLAADLPLPS